MKKWSALLLAACMILSLAACSSSDGQISVTTAKVKTGAVLSDSSYSGELKPSAEVTVVPKLSAVIETVNYDVGDTVNAGDVIVTLDSSDVQDQVKQAQAAYDTAQAAYESTAGGNTASTQLKLQQAVQSAQTEYDNALTSYNTVKANSDSGADIAQAQLSVDNAQASYDKIAYLVSIGEESDYSLQQAKLTLDTAQSALTNAKTSSQTNLDTAQYHLTSAQNALTAAQQNLQVNVNSVLPESAASAQQQVESAKVSLDIATSALDDTQIVAPSSGIISAINATVGEMASPQTTSVTIIDQSTIDFVISVTESDVVQITQGMEVGVRLDGVGDSRTGTVKTVDPSADETTGLFDVTITMDNSDGSLKNGMTATAVFSDDATRAIYIPKDAVIHDDSGDYVYKMSGQTVQKTQVTLGQEKNLYIQVTDGLTEDDSVVVDGLAKVTDGGTVKIVKNVE